VRVDIALTANGSMAVLIKKMLIRALIKTFNVTLIEKLEISTLFTNFCYILLIFAFFYLKNLGLPRLEGSNGERSTVIGSEMENSSQGVNMIRWFTTEP
jgi:hypothetical protein